MRPRSLFVLGLTAFILLYVGYGVYRFALGVDFTDEGAYVAWPLRLLFGEPAFASELMTLHRPLEVFFTLPFQLRPGIALYELRLLGWSVHLLSFAILASFLFRLSAAPWQSLLVASVPFFVCNIFGLISPSYNSLSSDFLLIALSLRGLSSATAKTGTLRLEICGGLALFVATLAHPGLGLVAAVILVHEIFRNDLGQNLRRRQLTPSNIGVLTFVACWAAFLLYLAASGALANWIQRIALTHSFAANSLQIGPVPFFIQLATYPFSYSRLALAGSALIAPTAVAAVVLARTGKSETAARAAAALAGLLIVSLLATFSYEPDYLSVALVRAALVAVAFGVLRPATAAEGSTTFLLLLSVLAAGIYATLTYYFSPQRSWIAGTLGLPLAFAVGLTQLLRAAPARLSAWRLLVPLSVALLVACAAREHSRNLYRDAAPAELDATFQLPKLRGIRSTAERVRAVEELYAFLHPQLARGAPLLAFDDCPMLYFIFDARPAYGLTWAVRYTQDPVVLRQLDAELRAQPLPRFAIRTLVDISHVVWRTAPRTNYDHYPLNETVTTRYALVRTIFPFEIWELKSGRSLEKASPRNPAP